MKKISKKRKNKKKKSKKKKNNNNNNKNKKKSLNTTKKTMKATVTIPMEISKMNSKKLHHHLKHKKLRKGVE